MRATTKKRGTIDAARKRAAVEVVARYEPALRRTARRYSLSAEDAEDAFQRAMEILLTKAPTTDPGELIRWTQTVTKHEALAVRRSRKQSAARLAKPPHGVGKTVDWIALVPAEDDGPDERAERREAIARSREALRALRPAERRALSLLAGGCSYAEIGRLTGFSQSKVNRSIAEGRERFRRVLSHSEDGSRCEELRPLLSAFCDGEASAEEAAPLREHLRACGSCRAAMRAYRATPRAVAALAPAPFALGTLLERAREIATDLQARLPSRGGATDSAVAQVAATGGAKGAGMAALAKVAIVCAGAAGGAAACVAAGVIPAPLGVFGGEAKQAPVEGRAGRSPNQIDASEAAAEPRRASKPRPRNRKPATRETDGAVEASTVEYAPSPEATPQPAPEPTPAPASPAPEAAPVPAPPSTTAPSSSSGSAAGEFGP